MPAKKPAISHRLRRTICMAVLPLPFAFVTTPGFAQHPSAVRPSSAHLWKDPAANACTHNGLPCSTSPSVVSAQSKSASTRQQLEQIERQSVTVVRGNAARGSSGRNTPVYRPTAVRGSGGQSSAINFAYHAPQGGPRGSNPGKRR